MSWIIQSLLRSSVELKSLSDINSDEFNDLMIIEKKINHLREDGLISGEEMSLLKYIEDGKPLVNSKEEFGKNRLSLAKDIEALCNKIAFYVGGYFTNDGYIHYMRNKYKLSNEETHRMIEYMKGKYKNKLIRKQTKQNE